MNDSSAESYSYIGRELDLFRRAANWKRYWAEQVRPYLRGEVLEVGAGIGGSTEALPVHAANRWLCLEPDAWLAQTLAARVEAGELTGPLAVRIGSTRDLQADELFDAVLYADVLEHIEEDAAEVERVARHIKPGGHLIALSPAHNWLFTTFDDAVGHYRRYDLQEFAALAPSSLRVTHARYLDSCGLWASAGNRLLLKSGTPTAAQIGVWDRVLVPVSTWLDHSTRQFS